MHIAQWYIGTYNIMHMSNFALSNLYYFEKFKNLFWNVPTSFYLIVKSIVVVSYNVI